MKSRSLKAEIQKNIQKNYPKLSVHYTQEWRDKLSSDNSYYLIGIAILVIFFIIIIKHCFPFFDFLNVIYITKETAKKALDDRIANVATLVSFSLAIATFLIANSEKKGKENREILIKRINLYPTLYFALVILFFFFVIN